MSTLLDNNDITVTDGSSRIYEKQHPSVAEEVKMLFSRSEGREFEPPRETLFKGFGNLYTTFP